MSKLTRMSHVTPLPPSVTREAAIAHLHNHRQMIQLNPLVLRHDTTTPHANAAPDEATGMVWYEITDEIQYIPGTPLKGEVSYKAGFYDLPTGLQTHTFAAGGVDIRGKWTVGGSLPGEEKEEVEIGTNKPREGLYILEEVDLKCNMLLTNFVKRNLKKSHATLVESIIQKASTADLTFVRPEHTRTASGLPGEAVQPSAPSTVSSWSSMPTSYSHTGADRCSCTMAAFGVHMENCQKTSARSQPDPSHASVPEFQLNGESS